MKSILVTISLLVLVLSPTALAQSKFVKTLAGLSYYKVLKISPKGTYIAASLSDEGKSSLVFFDTATMKVVDVMKFRDPDEIGEFHWVSDERVVMQVNSHIDNHDEVFDVGEIFAITVGRSKGKYIFGYRASLVSGKTDKRKSAAQRQRAVEGWGRVIDLLPESAKEVLITVKPYSYDRSNRLKIYRLNTDFGLLKVVTEVPMSYATVFTNGFGKIIGAIGTKKKGEFSGDVMLYDETNDRWSREETLSKLADFNFVSFDAAAQEIIFTTGSIDQRSALYRFNIKSAAITPIFVDQSLDLTIVEKMSDAETPFAVRTDPVYPSYTILGASSNGQFFRQLTAVFKDQAVEILSYTQTRRKFIIGVHGDQNPGSFYLYDKDSNKISLLLNRFPAIEALPLQPSHGFKFKATDELEISGYITLPQEPVSKDTPSVVLVHGGPFGTRDYATFDEDVQYITLFSTI